MAARCCYVLFMCACYVHFVRYEGDAIQGDTDERIERYKVCNLQYEMTRGEAEFDGGEAPRVSLRQIRWCCTIEHRKQARGVPACLWSRACGVEDAETLIEGGEEQRRMSLGNEQAVHARHTCCMKLLSLARAPLEVWTSNRF